MGGVDFPVETFMVQQSLKRNPRLHPSESRSEAEMKPSSEGDLAPWFAVDHELVGPRKRALVTVCGAEEE